MLGVQLHIRCKGAQTLSFLTIMFVQLLPALVSGTVLLKSPLQCHGGPGASAALLGLGREALAVHFLPMPGQGVWQLLRHFMLR